MCVITSDLISDILCMKTECICCTGNTRVITQSALQTFQEEMKKAMKDPYKVVINQTKLPISLLNEKAKVLFSVLSFILC